MRVLPIRTGMGAILLSAEGCHMRHLALCGVCRADRATVRPWNQFVPVTRPLSLTGEREGCSILAEGGDASAWPSFCSTIDYERREEKEY